MLKNGLAQVINICHVLLDGKSVNKRILLKIELKNENKLSQNK